MMVTKPEELPHELKVPQPTIERLSAYLQCVRGMRADGVSTASSSEIAKGTGINAAQFRKDLSYFGEFGTPGLGYDVAELEAHLCRIMGLDINSFGNSGYSKGPLPGLA